MDINKLKIAAIKLEIERQLMDSINEEIKGLPIAVLESMLSSLAADSKPLPSVVTNAVVQNAALKNDDKKSAIKKRQSGRGVGVASIDGVGVVDANMPK